MPIYLYQHPKTKEVKEVVQRMTEEHVYSENGVAWVRIFVNPNAHVSTISTIDPFSQNSFMDKTSKMKGTLGDLWNLSAELSEKRAKKEGVDKVKQKAAEAYTKKTTLPHPHLNKTQT